MRRFSKKKEGEAYEGEDVAHIQITLSNKEPNENTQSKIFTKRGLTWIWGLKMTSKNIRRIKTLMIVTTATCFLAALCLIHSQSQAITDSIGYGFHEMLFVFSEILSYAVYIEAAALVIFIVRLLVGNRKTKTEIAPEYKKSLCSLGVSVSCAFLIFAAVAAHYNNMYEEIIFTDSISKYIDEDERVCYIKVNGQNYAVGGALYDAASEGTAYACTVRKSKTFGREKEEIVYLKALTQTRFK